MGVTDFKYVEKIGPYA